MPDLGFEFRWVDPRSLVANPRNPRRLGREGAAKLERAIREFGFTTPALVQASTGMLIAGHQRTTAAIAVGLERIPTVWADVDDATAEKIMLADNRLGEEAEWDSDRLAAIFAEVGGDVAALAGFTDEEYQAVLEAWTTEIDGARRHPRTVIDWDRLALFYHAAPGATIGAVPGLHQAASWSQLAELKVPLLVLPRPPDTRLLVLADSALGVDRSGVLWGSKADQQNVAGTAALARADLVEAPGVPLSPAVLRDLGFGRREALERHGAIAVEFSHLLMALNDRPVDEERPLTGQLWRLPGEGADHAVVLERVRPFVRAGDVVGLEVGSDPGLAFSWTQAVVAALPDGPAVHLCGVSDPKVAAAGLSAGAVSLDAPVAASSGWDQLLVPVRRIDGSFGTKRLRFEEILSIDLEATGKLRAGLAVSNWLAGALMFEATLAVETGAVKEGE